MYSRKAKYVRIEHYDQIILFPELVQHANFKHLNPISAGFCFITLAGIECYGESVSLGLKSNEKEDSKLATKQYFEE